MDLSESTEQDIKHAVKDRRIDRFLLWIIPGLLAIIGVLGGAFLSSFKDDFRSEVQKLSGTVETLSLTVQQLGTQVAVQQERDAKVLEMKEEQRRLRQRLEDSSDAQRALDIRLTAVEYQLGVKRQ